MPTYTYECEKDEIIIEVVHGMAESPIVSCEACGAPMNRIIHVSEVIFLGGGWADDGYQ